MRKHLVSSFTLALALGISQNVNAVSAKANNHTVVVDHGVPPVVQIKTLVVTPEKLYLLTTFLEKGYPFAASNTRDILPLILKTEQQKQQYFGGFDSGVTSLFSSRWVQARNIRVIASALCDYSLKTYQGRKKSGWYEWKPAFNPKELEDSFLEDSKQALLTSVDVLKIPLRLQPPRFIVESGAKRVGVTGFIYTTYPLSALDSMATAITGFGAIHPTDALPVKARLKSINQTQRDYSKKLLPLLQSKSWSYTRENAQTMAFANLSRQRNRILLQQLDSLKVDIATMFARLKKEGAK